MAKEYKRLKPDDLRRYPALKTLTDEQAEEAIDALERFSVFAYNYYMRLVRLGVADENGAIPADWATHPALLADLQKINSITMKNSEIKSKARKTKRAAIYLRTNTLLQPIRDNSRRMQEEELKKYCDEEQVKITAIHKEGSY